MQWCRAVLACVGNDGTTCNKRPLVFGLFKFLGIRTPPLSPPGSKYLRPALPGECADPPDRSPALGADDRRGERRAAQVR